jgi:septum formation topological specificity factor MinE
MHHVGIPLLKNTIVATIEKHVNIHTHKLHVHNIRENAYESAHVRKYLRKYI